MKAIVLFITLAISSISFAGNREDAFNGICAKMNFDSNKQDCVKKIGQYRHFSENAIRVCGSMNFDSNKLSCVDAIGDRSYQAYETTNCSSQSFDSTKLSCLSAAGQAGSTSSCMTEVELTENLMRAKQLVRRGDIFGAEDQLNYMISVIRQCTDN